MEWLLLSDIIGDYSCFVTICDNLPNKFDNLLGMPQPGVAGPVKK